MTRQVVPKHLKAETARWWRSVTKSFELEDHHVRLLTLACEAWDRCAEARERIAQDGAYLADRFGQLKAHPATAVESTCRGDFAKLLRELDLDVEGPADETRPPALRRFRNA